MNQVATIATALLEIFTLGYKVFNLFKEAKDKKWIDSGRLLSHTISEAKTDEERSKLARDLFNRINK